MRMCSPLFLVPAPIEPVLNREQPQTDRLFIREDERWVKLRANRGRSQNNSLDEGEVHRLFSAPEALLISTNGIRIKRWKLHFGA